jgi:hypothetical protein
MGLCLPDTDGNIPGWQRYEKINEAFSNGIMLKMFDFTFVTKRRVFFPVTSERFILLL